MSDGDDKFWAQVESDAKRTILCEPHRFDEIQALIKERGYKHLTLRPSRFCPEGQILIIDESAIEASDRQTIQRLARGLYR